MGMYRGCLLYTSGATKGVVSAATRAKAASAPKAAEEDVYKRQLYAYVSQDPMDEGYLGGRVNNNCLLYTSRCV